MNERGDLTIVMPCLNEVVTVGECVRSAVAWMAEAGVDGVVLVVDNGSTDGSVAAARGAGALVQVVHARGYGHAVMGGLRAASTSYVAIADCDGSYDFSTLGPFLEDLRAGADLVIGDRFAGGIAPGAMSLKNHYVGNPLLSAMTRRLFGTHVRDVHCGLRAFRRQAILGMGLRAGGMEFATEMVVRSAQLGLDVRERPTPLYKDGRGKRGSHLRPWRDGLRHVQLMVSMARAR